MSRSIVAEDLGRGFSICQRAEVLEVTIYKPDFFVEVAMVEPKFSGAGGFEPMRVFYSRDRWVMASPLGGQSKQWIGMDHVLTPLKKRTESPEGGPIASEAFTCKPVEQGVSVGIVQAKYGRWVKVNLVRGDQETGTLLIAHDRDDLEWCLMKPDTMPIFSEQPSLFVHGFHEVTRIEGYARRLAYNSGGADALENSGDSRLSSSAVRKMLRGEE